MKFGLKGYLLTLFISLITFAWLIQSSIRSETIQEINFEAKKGKIIFEKKACIECHTIFGNGGYFGGDLTKIYEKFGRDGLKDYLVHPPLITGSKVKRHDHLTEEEADDMIAYLIFVGSINTMDWPPRPARNNQMQSQ